MRKELILTGAALIIVFCLAQNAAGYEDAIKSVLINKDTVKQYEAVEMSASIVTPYKNPYNYDEVDLKAEVTDPDGKTFVIPAFYTGSESTWKIRYTPVRAGRFSYRLAMKSSAGTCVSGLKYFEVSPGSANGFLRKGVNNPFYLVFDSGKPFFGLGHNIAWSTNNMVSTYAKYFSLLKDNGCNLTRIWLNAPWTFCIEGDRTCAYNALDSEKVDSLLELAGNYGIYIVLVQDTYGALMDEHGGWEEQFWKKNPYNKANSGPCAKPWDFFTDAESKRCYKNRLKYVIARWGYSPNILAFELWNEVDAPKEWVKEMTSYIKSINVHGQLVTTSLGYPWGNNFDESSIWAMKELDIIERHIYGDQTRDVIGYLASTNIELSKKYNKCLFVGEFGMDAGKNDAEIDGSGEGVALHASLWASALTRCFASSLNWWWADYVKGKNLHAHYKALRNFIQDVDWSSKRVEFLNTTPIMTEKGLNPVLSPVLIYPTRTWGDTNYTEFTISNNGDVAGGAVNTYLHAPLKKEMRIEPVFHVNYPADGKFIIQVDVVSQGANLVISLDGGEVENRNFPAGAGAGPWKRSLYRKDVGIYQCVYDTPVGIDVPRGIHTIKLSNTGVDWLSIKNITLVNYTDSNFANARCLGLRVGEAMLLWIQNKDYNWKDMKMGPGKSRISGASFKILDVKNGNYDIEWWDTFKGRIILRNSIAAANGEMVVNIPHFTKDIACKIRKID